MPIRLQSTLTRLQTTGAWLMHIFANITGLSDEVAKVVLIIIGIYLIVLIVFIPLHKSLRKALLKRTIALTLDYDTLRYLVAKAQQKSTTTSQEKGITILFDQTPKNYLAHHAEIKQEIQKIESSLGTAIVDAAQWTTIEKKRKKRTNLKAFTNIYGWCLSVITLFVYRLFR